MKRRRKVGSKSSKADQLAKGNSSGGSHTLTTNLVSYEKKYLLKTTSNKSNILWADPRELVPFTNNVWKALDYDRKKKYHKAMKRWFTSTGIDPQGSGRRLNVVRTEPTRKIQNSCIGKPLGVLRIDKRGAYMADGNRMVRIARSLGVPLFPIQVEYSADISDFSVPIKNLALLKAHGLKHFRLQVTTVDWRQGL